MRVLAIGLGSSGSRIVDSLYEHDRKSGVGAMQPVAIDTDANALMALRFIPVSARLHFATLDLAPSADICHTIHSGEIMAYIQGADTVRIDALLLCCGLGGCMCDVVTAIVPELRKSFIEPIFMVVTLPCREEGEKRSAKAADDLERIESIVDCMILFDNETWYRKIHDHLVAQQEKGGEVRETNPKMMFDLLNEQIARRVGLILRAGEFNEKGFEVAEIVLDAGEVLNTLRGMGFVAIGYASEEIPSTFLGIFNHGQLNRYFMESSQIKAARIVALAKKAVYDEISIPCDLTSAEKALVLIAGPSHELSMRGFQTVRTWIDRSIAGLEVRSGDYPIRNSRFVGIVIALSGLKNIPRVEELRQIREQYRNLSAPAPAPPLEDMPGERQGLSSQPRQPEDPSGANPPGSAPSPEPAPAIVAGDLVAADPPQSEESGTSPAPMQSAKPRRKADSAGRRKKKKDDGEDGLTWIR